MSRSASFALSWRALGALTMFSLVGCSVLVDKKLSDKPKQNELEDEMTAPDARVPDDDDEDGGNPAPGKPDAGDGDGDGDAEVDAAMPFDRSSVRFSMGYDHACGLFPDGHAKCWGQNDENQRNLPKGPFLDVACGDYHTCVLDQKGALTCVGRNRDGQRVTAEGPYTHVAAGDAHSCALTAEGKVDCWGKSSEGQATPPPDVTFKALTAGTSFTCGIRKSDSKVQCWGSSSSNRTKPPNKVWKSIDAGEAHACGVTADDEALCWGELAFAAPPLSSATHVAAGNFVSCAVLDDRSAHCWPVNDHAEWTIPNDDAGPYVNVVAGPHAVCFITQSANPDCYSLGDSPLVPAPPDYFEQ